MNIHEYQAKELLKEYGAPVTDGVVVLKPEDSAEKIRNFKTDQIVIKAQIHAGGRGKAGGVKLINKLDYLENINSMFGKILVTHQTGPEGKKVEKIYVQEAYNIEKEYYLSCLVVRKPLR